MYIHMYIMDIYIYVYIYICIYVIICTYITKITAFGQPPTLQFHSKFHNIHKIRNFNPMNRGHLLVDLLDHGTFRALGILGINSHARPGV